MGKLMARQSIELNTVERELPSTSGLAKKGDTELQEIAENAARNMNNLIEQFKGTLPMHELQGLDKQLRSIKGSLKVEVAKKLSYSNASN